MACLDPDAFRRCFREWVRAVSKLTPRPVVALDGKQRRRSHDGVLGQKAIWLVSAWATANQVVWGQTQTQAQSNEIKAIPERLRLLELTGGIVTIDALGCQTKIAETISQRGGDYQLAVKENQGKLYEDLKDLLAGYPEAGVPQVPHDYVWEVTQGQGRLEIREGWTVSDPESLRFVRP